MTAREKIVEIFETNNHLLRIYAEKIVENEEEAKDMVNDVFLKLMENENITHITKSLQAYLYRSVYNNCLNCLKQKEMTYKCYKDMNNNDLDGYHSKNPLALLINEETLTQIEIAIENLPTKCKEIFLLAKMEGLSYKEIADKFGITINTVNKQISIAKQKIKDSLDKQDVIKNV